MKKFGKILSFILSLIMITAVCPSFAMGAVTAEDVAAGINLDLMTTESGYAITKDLDFSAVMSMVENEGATLKLTSSNSSVVKISGNSGLVTRPQSENAEITLTAEVSKNGETAQKNITFTVLPLSVYVLESEGFGRPEAVGKDISTIGTSWGKSTVTAAEKNYLSASIASHADGYSLDFAKSAYSATMTPYARYDFANTPESNAVRVSFTVIPNEITVEDGTGDTIYEFQFYGTDENGGAITNSMNFIRIFGGKSQVISKTLRVRYQMANNEYFYGANVAFGDSVRFDLDYNFKGKELTIYANGTKVNTVELMKGQTGTAAGLSRMTFNILRNGVTGSYSFDDFTVTAKKSDLIVDEFTVNDGGALTAEVNGSKKQISVTSKYNSENTLTQTFGVYTSSNQHIEYYDAYLTNKGGNVTYLWEQGQGRTSYVSDESAPLNVNGVFMGGNHAASCVRLTINNHGKTVADVGTLWRDSAGKDWVLTNIVDKNRIKVMATEHGSGSQLWVFSRAISGDTLTRIENGTATDEILTFTAKTNDQQFPSVRNSVQTVTAYLPDGTTKVLDLATSQSVKADKIEIVDTYEITDPTLLAEELQRGHKEGYSETNLPNYNPGDTVITYKQIITIMDDGTVLTEFDHKLEQKINYLAYYGYQYLMKGNLGGGVKRLMPGTIAFEANPAVFTARDSATADTSKTVTFDFSEPRQLYRLDTGLEYNTFDLPAPHHQFNKNSWLDQNTVPNRLIDFMCYADGTSDIAFASGFLPIGDGTKEARLKNTYYSFYMPATAKAYPYLINQNKTAQGATIKAVAYRKFEDADRFDGQASVYSVPLNDTVYYNVDLLKDGSVTFDIPGVTAENIVMEENSGEAVVTVANGKVTVSGDKKDFVVFTVPRSGIEIREVSRNIYGTVSVAVSNLGADYDDASVICAGYKNSKLTVIEKKTVNVINGNIAVTFDSDFSGAESYRVYLFDKNNKLQPLC